VAPPPAPYLTEIVVELGPPTAAQVVRVSASGSYRGTLDVQRHGYALLTGEGVVLIDPNEPAPESRAAFEALVVAAGRPPLATVLTSSWHERAAYELRDRYGTPVWLPRGGTGEAEGAPDHVYGEASALPGGLRALTIQDAIAGDTVLCWQAATGERVLFTGDALLGGSRRPGHWRGGPGLYAWMHGRPSGPEFLARFHRLLQEDFDLICSAHGWPVPFRDRPKALLARLLDTGRFVSPSVGVGLAPP
jgi:glyoxylase-like metal-dependent hydrolase (beta-lactamase superfamily II)